MSSPVPVSDDKEYAAFLSFADPDKELAECLRNLLSELGKKVFFAPVDLPKPGNPQWGTDIINRMRKSASFVPIYTRNSLNRPWVLYESGLADALEVPCFPAYVSSISPSEIGYSPGLSGSAYYYGLSNPKLLSRLMVSICVAHGDAENSLRVRSDSLVQTSSLARRVMELSRARWVFVAGNYPNNAIDEDSGIAWFTTREKYLQRMQGFAGEITQVLLEKGFSVAACPQVASLGMHVIEQAVGFLDTVVGAPHVDYAINGIYPIDREAREGMLSDAAKKRWRDHIMDFRKSYLADKEWLILLGGNEGTAEEYSAAKQAGVKVMPIPCFGGFSQEVFSDGVASVVGPCRDCIERNGLCGRSRIAEIVEAIESN